MLYVVTSHGLLHRAALYVVVGFRVYQDLNPKHPQPSTLNPEQEKMEKIQKTLEFLMENECPRQLRTQIIQWTRFTEVES